MRARAWVAHTRAPDPLERGPGMAQAFTLSTTRLALTPLTVLDSPWFWRLNTHPHTREHLWDGDVISTQQAADVLAQSAAFFRHQRFGLWKASHAEAAVGYYGLWFFFDEPQPQILYVTDPGHTRRGYAAEAVSAVARYAFETLDFAHLDAAVEAGNDASRALARSLGMQPQRESVVDGKPTVVFRLDREAFADEGEPVAFDGAARPRVIARGSDDPG